MWLDRWGVGLGRGSRTGAAAPAASGSTDGSTGSRFIWNVLTATTRGDLRTSKNR